MTSLSSPNRRAIESDQLDKLCSLLSLLPSNPFYRRKLQAAGITPSLSGLEDFSKRMPFTLKQELIDDQCENPPYGSNLSYSLERYARLSQTSATTGKPMRWLDTAQDWEWMLNNWTRVYQAAGVTARDRIFFAFSFAPFLGFWTAFESAVRLGCMCIPGGGLSSVARLRMILENEITVLCCAPTYALRLAQVAVQEEVKLSGSKVKRIIVAGEPGGSIPSTCAEIERSWPGARVVDHHGMTEVGPVSYGCPKRPGILHVIESSYIAEVIDFATGQAVQPGEKGELVLTNLGRTGSPLLRYRTGDLIQPCAEQPCACGSYELGLPGGILGRTDDMVVVRGVNIYPSAVEEIIRACGGVAEFRVEIPSDRTLPELTIKAEAFPGQQEPKELAERLEAALRSAFALRIPVSIVPSGTLPRFEMKARRWVRV